MTDPAPQDAGLSAAEADRIARIAIDDLVALYKGTSQAAFVHADDGLSSVHINGKIDMLRLVRVMSAALKREP